jgi:16S rRNA (uracil1498-N3)-methyltransferase
MARRYFVDTLPLSGPANLHGEVVHHLVHVMRVSPGDHVTLGDGRGLECQARIEGHHKDTLHVTVAAHTAVVPPLLRVHVAFAPPRFTRAEWLFEHGSVVGVAVFHPLWTERTRPQGDRSDRWQKIVRAAAGQCDRAWLPEIRPLRSVREFLVDPKLPRDRRIAQGGAPKPSLVSDGDVLLLVGPEGGLAPDEQTLALKNGFAPVGLGPNVLRTETAALVGASALLLFTPGTHVSGTKADSAKL